MTKLFSCISALILLFWLSFTVAQDETEPGMSPDASEDAGGGTGLAPEPGKQSESDALRNRQHTDTSPPLTEQEKEIGAHDAQICTHCNESEQLVVDLNYYKQITDILKGINENYDGINTDAKKSIHDLVVKINPKLADVMFKSTEQEMSRQETPRQETPRQETPRQIIPGEAVKYSAISPMLDFGRNEKEQPEDIDKLKKEFATLKQELSTMKRSYSAEQKNNKPRQNTTGIDGLILKHVNEENPITGAQVRVVVGSHHETKYLSLNSTFKHNEIEFAVKAIEKQGDDSPDRLHLVIIENTKTGETHNIPW